MVERKEKKEESGKTLNLGDAFAFAFRTMKKQKKKSLKKKREKGVERRSRKTQVSLIS